MSAEERQNLVQVIEEIVAERARGRALHGAGDHPDGTRAELCPLMEHVRSLTEARQDVGQESWLDILAEEFMEVAAEEDPVKLRRELIQVAAVATRWAESLTKRLK